MHIKNLPDVRLESQHITLWLLVWYQTNTKYDRGVNPRWDDMKKNVQIHPLMCRIYKLYSIQMWAVLNANRNENRRRNDISVGIRLNKNFLKNTSLVAIQKTRKHHCMRFQLLSWQCLIFGFYFTKLSHPDWC